MNNPLIIIHKDSSYLEFIYFHHTLLALYIMVFSKLCNIMVLVFLLLHIHKLIINSFNMECYGLFFSQCSNENAY